MRCHEARKRLIAAQGRMALYGHDRGLLDHLRQCRKCASLAQAELTLKRDLEAATPDDNVDVIGLPAFRTRVEARAAGAAPRKYREIGKMSEMVQNLKRRPRLGLTLGLAAVILLFVTLVPMKWDREVGYEVALAGVDPTLAMDEFRIQRLLDKLGIENADIELGECEATCKLTIGQLKDEKEVKIVTTAFDEMGNCVLEFVEPVMGEQQGTLAGHMRNVFFSSQSDDDDDQIHEIVISCLAELGEDGDGYSIWISDSSCGQATVDIAADHCDSVTMAECMQIIGDGPGCAPMQIIHQGQEMTFGATDEDGDVHQINILDEDAAEQLAALGFDVETLTDGDSIISMALVMGNCGPASGSGDGAAKFGDDGLPDNFMLAQNYPNPFNPTTTIEFTLPTSEHTSLDVYNVKGQRVKTLVDEVLTAGSHAVQWNATDDGGSRVASGVYFYRLTAGDNTVSKKMTLLK